MLTFVISNIFGFLFSDDLSNVALQIDEDDCTSLQPIESTQTQKLGVKEVNVSTTSLSLLSLLSEQGLHSGHCFRPKLNHRDLNYNTFAHNHMNDDGNIHPPLMESLINNPPNYGHDMGSEIGIFFYEVRYQEGESNVFSNGQIQVNVGSMKYFGKVTAKNVQAKPLTMNSFKRLLLTFGLKLPVEWANESHVTLDMLASFVLSLKKASLATVEDMKNTLKSFKVDRWFQYDDSVSLELNRERLGQLWRALQMCRKDSYDGQHRDAAARFATIGYYNISNAVLENSRDRRMTFEGWKKKASYVINEGTTESNFQSHKPLGIKIGQVSKSMGFEGQLEVLRNFGHTTTSTARTNVNITLATIACELLMSLQDDGGFRNLANIAHDSFWCVQHDTFKNNQVGRMTYLGNAVVAFIQKKGHQDFFQTNRIEWSGVPGNLQNALTKNSGVGRMIDIKNLNIKGVPQNAATLLNILKHLLITKEGWDAANRFFQNAPPTNDRENGPIPDEAVAIMRGWTFLLHNVTVHVEDVFDALSSRLHCEKHVATTLPNSKTNEEVRTIYDQVDPEKKVIDFSTWSLLKDVVEKPTAMKASLFTKTRQRVQNFSFRCNAAVLTELYLDVFKTISTFGMNPKLSRSYFLTSSDIGRQIHGTTFTNDSMRFYTMSMNSLEHNHLEEVKSYVHMKEDVWPVEVGRCTMVLMLHLWKERIKTKFNVGSGELEILCPFVAHTREEFYEKPCIVKWSEGCIEEGNEERFHGKEKAFFLPESVRFSTFVRKFLDDEIDVEHVFPNFHKHVMSKSKKGEHILRFFRQQNAENISSANWEDLKKAERKNKKRSKSTISGNKEYLTFWFLSNILFS